MWIARDKDNSLWLYKEYAFKGYSRWCGNTYFEIDSKLFPEVTWEDEEPTEVELVIKNNGL